jgi:hypothetical protein
MLAVRVVSANRHPVIKWVVESPPTCSSIQISASDAIPCQKVQFSMTAVEAARSWIPTCCLLK